MVHNNTQGENFSKLASFVWFQHGVVMPHLHNTLNSEGASKRTHLLQVLLGVNTVCSGLQYLQHQPILYKLHNTQPHSAKREATKEG